MNNKNSSSGQLSHVTNSTSSPSPNKRLAFKMVRSTF